MLLNDVMHAPYHNLSGTVKICMPWKHLVGVYREQLMEYWQSHGMDNVGFEEIRSLQISNPVKTYPNIPASIRQTFYLLHAELPKDWYAAAVMDICMQFNAGRRS